MKWKCDYNAGWNESHTYYLDKVLALSEDRINPNNIQQLDALVDRHFSIFALKGKFANFASECVKQIVDDFSLPNDMKTIKPTAGMKGEEVYRLNGMVISLVNSLSEDTAFRTSSILTNDLVVSDGVKHKMAGHENSSSSWLQNTIAANSKTFGNLRVPISFVIDYAGFRFRVFSDMEVSENKTLSHGFSFSESVFVNADKSVDAMIPKLARKLGLTHVPRLTPGRSSTISSTAGALRIFTCVVVIFLTEIVAFLLRNQSVRRPRLRVLQHPFKKSTDP